MYGLDVGDVVKITKYQIGADTPKLFLEKQYLPAYAVVARLSRGAYEVRWLTPVPPVPLDERHWDDVYGGQDGIAQMSSDYDTWVRVSLDDLSDDALARYTAMKLTGEIE